MTNKDYQRSFARAPLNTSALYVEGDYVYKAKVMNISEGGILIEQLPCVPKNKVISMMISIPFFPNFNSLNVNEISPCDFHSTNIKKWILRVEGEIVRSFEDVSNVEGAFIKGVGCKFVTIGLQTQAVIQDYISIVLKNIETILILFQSLDNNSEFIYPIRILASVLGYDIDQEITLLRHKIMHDYQSLKEA